MSGQRTQVTIDQRRFLIEDRDDDTVLHRFQFTRDMFHTEWNKDKTLVAPTGAFGPADATYDVVFMRRLAAFVKSDAFSKASRGIFWDHLTASHQELVDLLANDKLQEAFDYLNVMHSKPLMVGITSPFGGPDFMTRNPRVAEATIRRAHDVLLGVGELVGCLPTQNPEQGPNCLTMPIEDIVSNLPAFEFPKWQGGNFGISTSRGLATERNLLALYTAIRIEQMQAADPTRHSKSYVEIGGGAGYVSYWLASAFGYNNLTSVDQPTVLIGQAFQYAQNMGSDHVCLPNETPHVHTMVRLLVPEQFNQEVRTKHEIVYNVDSMPEMDEVSIMTYLMTIARTATKFFSFNQESMSLYFENGEERRQRHVSRDIGLYHSIHGRTFESFARNKSWVRDGYVEEWFILPKNIQTS